jgi:hypothetical protein
MEKIIKWFDANYKEDEAFIVELLTEFSLKTFLEIEFIEGACIFLKENNEKHSLLKNDLNYLYDFINGDFSINSDKDCMILDYIHFFFYKKYNCKREDIFIIIKTLNDSGYPYVITEASMIFDDAKEFGMKPIDVCKVSVEIDEILEDI